MDTHKAFTFGYDGNDNAKHHDVLQVLRPVRKYYFDDACIFFIKDADNGSFIQCLLQLPTIQYERTYNMKKMSEEQMIAHVTQLHEAQKKKRLKKKKLLLL